MNTIIENCSGCIITTGDNSGVSTDGQAAEMTLRLIAAVEALTSEIALLRQVVENNLKQI